MDIEKDIVIIFRLKFKLSFCLIIFTNLFFDLCVIIVVRGDLCGK